MRCEPASKIIDLFGGPKAVAEIVQVDISRVTRWRLPKASGGTNGLVPQKHIPTLLKAAKERKLRLRAEDFLPIEVA